MSFRQYGGLQFSSKNNYNNLINLTSQSDLPKTLGILNTTIDVLSTINQTDLTTLTYNVLNRTNIKGVSSYGLPILTTIDTNSNKGIALYPNAGDGAFNPAVSNGDNEIVATATSINTETLVVGTNQTVWNGLKIIPTKGTTLGTTTIGQGGEASFTTSFSCNGTNSIINGPAIFSSTTPPVSNQDIPDPDDSSNSIPTTAWVQGAIDYRISGGGGSGNITYTYTNGGTTQTVPVPTGSTFVKIICIGGGGGGGGGLGGTAAYESGAGGGGGGGISIVNVALLNETSFTIKVGNGGIGGNMQHQSNPPTNGGNGGDSYVYTILNSVQWYYAYAYGGMGGACGVTNVSSQPSGGLGGYGNQGVGGSGGNGCGVTNTVTGSAYPGGPSNGFLLNGINGNTSTQLGAGGGGGGGATTSTLYTSYGGDGGGIGNIGYSLIQGNGVGGINGQTVGVGATVPSTGPEGVGGGGGGGGPGGRFNGGGGYIFTSANGVYGGGGGGGPSNSTFNTLTRNSGSGGTGVVILVFYV
jgi:hypothetical protein